MYFWSVGGGAWSVNGPGPRYKHFKREAEITVVITVVTQPNLFHCLNFGIYFHGVGYLWSKIIVYLEYVITTFCYGSLGLGKY